MSTKSNPCAVASSQSHPSGPSFGVPGSHYRCEQGQLGTFNSFMIRHLLLGKKRILISIFAPNWCKPSSQDIPAPFSPHCCYAAKHCGKRTLGMKASTLFFSLFTTTLALAMPSLGWGLSGMSLFLYESLSPVCKWSRCSWH